MLAPAPPHARSRSVALRAAAWWVSPRRLRRGAGAVSAEPATPDMGPGPSSEAQGEPAGHCSQAVPTNASHHLAHGLCQAAPFLVPSSGVTGSARAGLAGVATILGGRGHWAGPLVGRLLCPIRVSDQARSGFSDDGGRLHPGHGLRHSAHSSPGTGSDPAEARRDPPRPATGRQVDDHARVGLGRGVGRRHPRPPGCPSGGGSGLRSRTSPVDSYEFAASRGLRPDLIFRDVRVAGPDSAPSQHQPGRPGGTRIAASATVLVTTLVPPGGRYEAGAPVQSGLDRDAVPGRARSYGPPGQGDPAPTEWALKPAWTRRSVIDPLRFLVGQIT